MWSAVCGCCSIFVCVWGGGGWFGELPDKLVTRQYSTVRKMSWRYSQMCHARLREAGKRLNCRIKRRVETVSTSNKLSRSYRERLIEKSTGHDWWSMFGVCALWLLAMSSSTWQSMEVLCRCMLADGDGFISMTVSTEEVMSAHHDWRWVHQHDRWFLSPFRWLCCTWRRWRGQELLKVD